MDNLLICLIKASSCAIVRHYRILEFALALEIVMPRNRRLRVVRPRPDLFAIAS
jgi:hypothetical protein